MNTPVLPRWWAIAIIALILANVISLFIFWRQQSHQPPPPPREPIGKGVQHLLQSIGYSPAQLAQVDSLREVHEKNMQPLLENKRKFKEAFFSLTSKQSVSDAELNAAASLVANNEQALDKQTFSFIQKVRALANKRQAEQFDSSLRQMIGALVGGAKPPMPPPMRNIQADDKGKPGENPPPGPPAVQGPPPHRPMPAGPPPPPPGMHDGPPPPPGKTHPAMPPPPPPPIKNDMNEPHQ